VFLSRIPRSEGVGLYADMRTIESNHALAKNRDSKRLAMKCDSRTPRIVIHQRKIIQNKSQTRGGVVESLDASERKPRFNSALEMPKLASFFWICVFR
jgi:hypothetical protein